MLSFQLAHLSWMLRMVHWGGATLWLLILSNPCTQIQWELNKQKNTTKISLNKYETVNRTAEWSEHQKKFSAEDVKHRRSETTKEHKHYQHKRTSTGIICKNLHFCKMLELVQFRRLNEKLYRNISWVLLCRLIT